MDTTVDVICPVCKNVKMDGNGGSFGGRITQWGKRCPKCELVLILIPTNAKYRYTITAETDEEQDERFAKKTRLRELEEESDKLRRELRI